MIEWTEIATRLALAAIFGAIIGIERERKNWVAGLRSHTLVCVGAALAMIVSAYGFMDVLEWRSYRSRSCQSSSSGDQRNRLPGCRNNSLPRIGRHCSWTYDSSRIMDRCSDWSCHRFRYVFCCIDHDRTCHYHLVFTTGFGK